MPSPSLTDAPTSCTSPRDLDPHGGRETAYAEDIVEMMCWFIDGPDLITGEALPIGDGARFVKLTPPA